MNLLNPLLLGVCAHPGVTQGKLHITLLVAASTLKHQVGIAGRRIRQQYRGYVKRRAQMLSREHLSGAAIGENAALVEQEQAIGKSRCQVKVMHHAYDEDILLRRKGPHLLHEIDLVTNIEEGQRLIEEEVADLSH